MRIWAHDRWSFPLREGHRYPVSKHRLLRERLLETGVCRPEDLLEAGPLRWSTLTRVQDAALLGRIRRGQMTVREQRGLGLPWSPELVERGRRVSHGTVLASHEALLTGVAINLGGGSHHAGRDFARGYCLFNDVALACHALRADGLARRALVVDCDVHQADGTAPLLTGHLNAFTLWPHRARNYPFRRLPSDLADDSPARPADSLDLRVQPQVRLRAAQGSLPGRVDLLIQPAAHPADLILGELTQAHLLHQTIDLAGTHAVTYASCTTAT